MKAVALNISIDISLFISVSFDSLQSSGYVVSHCRMTSEFGKMWKEAVVFLI